MKVEIQQNQDRIEIVAYRESRKVYCIEKIENGSWQIALATMPTGTVDEAKDICRLSLKCHDLLNQFQNGHVEVGSTVFLGTG